jgi:hypothetical protein
MEVMKTDGVRGLRGYTLSQIIASVRRPVNLISCTEDVLH